jgi:hypothetical protein
VVLEAADEPDAGEESPTRNAARDAAAAPEHFAEAGVLKVDTRNAAAAGGAEAGRK